jgi:hypothetical protein
MRIAISILLTIVGTMVLGQQDTSKNMDQMMKMMQPGEHHRALDVYVGDWDVAVTFRMGSGPEQHVKATCTAKWILDKRYLQSEYSGDMMGMPYHAIQMVGYDNMKQKYFEVMFENLDTGVAHNEGTGDGKTITCTGEIMESTGKPSKVRTVRTLKDQDHFNIEWFMVGANGKEVRLVLLEHTRRKA